MRTLRGFTLLEVLVAMGVFTVLGLGATAFLVAGLKTWRMAETRRDAAERAEHIFAMLREDITCLYTSGVRAPLQAIFLSDYDAGGRQRLQFSRTVPPPGADPRIAAGGRKMSAHDAIDGVNDLVHLRRGTLQGPGDLMSVAYSTSADGKLYRAVVTPAVDYRGVQTPWYTRGAHMVAEGVMHIEYNFWSARTRSWVPGENVFGPSYFWDSTMGLAKEDVDVLEASRRMIFPGTGSAADPGDDVFPRLVEIKVELSRTLWRGFTVLSEDLSASATMVRAEDLAGYTADEGEHLVKINAEWISYSRIDGNRLMGVKRGRRGTRPAEHAAGAWIEYGIPFRMVVRPPCFSAAWGRSTP